MIQITTFQNKTIFNTANFLWNAIYVSETLTPLAKTIGLLESSLCKITTWFLIMITTELDWLQVNRHHLDSRQCIPRNQVNYLNLSTHKSNRLHLG